MRLVWVNEERTIFVEAFIPLPADSAFEPVIDLLQNVYVTTRDDPSETWGPPETLRREPAR